MHIFLNLSIFNIFTGNPYYYLTSLELCYTLIRLSHSFYLLLLLAFWPPFSFSFFLSLPTGSRETCHRSVTFSRVDEFGTSVHGLASCPPPRDCRRVDQTSGKMLRLQTVSHQRLQVCELKLQLTFLQSCYDEMQKNFSPILENEIWFE